MSHNNPPWVSRTPTPHSQASDLMPHASQVHPSWQLLFVYGLHFSSQHMLLPLLVVVLRSRSLFKTKVTYSWSISQLPFHHHFGKSPHHLGGLSTASASAPLWFPTSSHSASETRTLTITLKHVLLFCNTKINLSRIPRKELFERIRHLFYFLL